jgi:hypothetical protein
LLDLKVYERTRIISPQIFITLLETDKLEHF